MRFLFASFNNLNQTWMTLKISWVLGESAGSSTFSRLWFVPRSLLVKSWKVGSDNIGRFLFTENFDLKGSSCYYDDMASLSNFSTTVYFTVELPFGIPKLLLYLLSSIFFLQAHKALSTVWLYEEKYRKINCKQM